MPCGSSASPFASASLLPPCREPGLGSPEEPPVAPPPTAPGVGSQLWPYAWHLLNLHGPSGAAPYPPHGTTALTHTLGHWGACGWAGAPWECHGRGCNPGSPPCSPEPRPALLGLLRGPSPRISQGPSGLLPQGQAILSWVAILIAFSLLVRGWDRHGPSAEASGSFLGALGKFSGQTQPLLPGWGACPCSDSSPQPKWSRKAPQKARGVVPEVSHWGLAFLQTEAVKLGNALP